MLEKHDVDNLFVSLAGIFPAWNQAIQTAAAAANAKRQWYEALVENEITPDEMREGMRQARATESPWLPSCGQFIQWCQAKSANKLPGKHQAYQEACLHQSGGDWSCPAVYHAASRTGLFDLKQQPESKTRPLFFEHYADVCSEVKQGARLELPEPAEPVKLEVREPNPEDQAHVRAMLDNLYKTLEEK